MNRLKINIVLPFFTTKPGGGTKIMYEYANRFSERGHAVSVFHSVQRPITKIKSPVWLKHLQYKARGLSRPPWFSLHSAVQSSIVPQITDKYIPDADIVLSTWWEMAYMISQLSAGKGKPFNLIQDYEIWKGHENLVHNSYKLPVQNLVIAKYLQKLVQKFSRSLPVHVPIAIDLEKFNLQQPIESRNGSSVIMLYSEEPRKGSRFGIEALIELKKSFPDLQVNLFGVYPAPDLPAWMNYYQKPPALAELMNQSAIFLTPSLGEGWALPPAEAMACGCAVICTDIGGHADYAFDGQTALLVRPENVNDIIGKGSLLIKDQSLRMKIASQAHDFIISNFNWDLSVTKMENFFYEALS
jgi:glycosyltransferase involved in cell wall biosynthesis